MHERITFAKVDPARMEEFKRVWHEELFPVLRAVTGNWRELMFEDPREPGRILYFSVWHTKEHANRFDAQWGFDHVFHALRPFFIEGPETRIFQTIGCNRPLVSLSDKFKPRG